MYIHTVCILLAMYLRMHCKIDNACIYEEYFAFLNIVEDNNTNDNYNDIATITPMTTLIITPILSSPPPLASTENIQILHGQHTSTYYHYTYM